MAKRENRLLWRHKGQNYVNLAVLAGAVFCFLHLLIAPGEAVYFYVMLALAFVFGCFLVTPIGAADMPVVMSLLNSYAGLTVAATGFVLKNNVLIIAGTLEGFASSIAGMPSLDVDRAKSVVVLKLGKGKGFSGLEKPLSFKPATTMLYGDAKATLRFGLPYLPLGLSEPL